MSAYQAKISLIVEGEQKIKSLQDRVNSLSKQITELKKLDIGGVFEDPVTSGAVSHLRKVRQKVHQDEAKATDGIIKGQRLLNNSTEQRLLQQIKLNAAVDLYAARVKALSRTGAGDQKQFQTRVEDIQKAFEFFKGKGSVRGVQAAATELGRIVEYSREVTRLETGRINSQEKLKGYGAEIAKYNKLGLDTSKAQATFDKYKVKAGTNQYVLADKYNSLLVKRLGVLKGESKESARIAQQQFGASSPVRGAVDLIGSPINKQMGTQAAVALAQQKQKAADLELKELQNGTKSAVALAQQKQKAADLELKELQNGTKSAVALAQQKQKAADLELKELQNGTKSAVALAQQKQKAADLELKELQKGTKAAVALAQQKQKAADQQKKAGGQRAESIALGVGFPLMFGAGPGSLAGSLAGSFVGSGFGGQILGGAIGAAFDKIGVAAIEAGKSLAYPIEGFEKLKEAGLFASREQEYYISKLIETGRVAEATAVIQAEMIKKVGVRGVNDLAALGESSIELSKVWAEFNLQLQAALAGPMTGLLKWLTGIVGLVGTINAEKTTAEEVRAGLSSKDRAKFDKEITKIRNAYGDVPGKAITFEEARKRKAQVVQEFESRSKPQSVRGVLTPEDREKAIKASEQQADIIKDAYRTGFRLQQQGIDLQRQGSDLQRRVAQDIYNKQQEILRLQVDNDRQRKQVAIEMVDLEYRRRISNEEGRVAAVLEAEAALMKTKAEGEANIEAKKRLLELDIDKQKRETENYIFELGRTIDGIRRSTLSLEMDVADYRLKIERQIGEQRRIEEAGQAAGAPTGGNKAPTTGQTIDKSVLRDWLIKQGFGRTTGDFTNRGHATPNHMLNAMDMGILGGSDAEALRKTKAMEAKLAATGAFGSQLYGPTRDPYGHGAGKGGQNIHLHIPTPGGKVKVTPGLSKLMGAGGSMEAQLQNAVGQPVTRPSVGTPDLSGVEATRIRMGKQDAQIRREALSIEQQLQNLREQGALDRLAEVARGPKEIQQRKDALAYAKAELATIGAASQDKQELLAFEAQSAVKLKIKEDENLKISNQIKANDALTTKQKADVLGKVQEALDITKQQIALDKEALAIAQQTRFEKEQAGIQAQLGVTGKGLQAGFIGQAGQAFESEMLKSGNAEQAQALAAQTQALELATTKARALEGAYQDIGGAMASTLTDGVARLVAGTTTAEQVFVDFLKNIGDALMKAAQQMIAQYLAIAAAKALAGLLGGGGSSGGGLPSFGDGGGFGSFEGGAFGTASGGLGGGDFSSFLPGKSFYKAAGGPVSSNSTYMVGEKGPELFVPRTSGTIVPADDTAAAMARYQRQGGSDSELDPAAAMARYQRQDGNSIAMGGMGRNGSTTNSVNNTTNNGYNTAGNNTTNNGYNTAGNNTTNNGYDTDSNTVNNIQTSPSPVLAFSFETTRFLGQDYVSTDQLQAAMMATEKRAAAAGAKAGAAQVTSKLQQSPAYRRQVGLR